MDNDIDLGGAQPPNYKHEEPPIMRDMPPESVKPERNLRIPRYPIGQPPAVILRPAPPNPAFVPQLSSGSVFPSVAAAETWNTYARTYDIAPGQIAVKKEMPRIPERSRGAMVQFDDSGEEERPEPPSMAFTVVDPSRPRTTLRSREGVDEGKKRKARRQVTNN